MNIDGPRRTRFALAALAAAAVAVGPLTASATTTSVVTPVCTWPLVVANESPNWPAFAPDENIAYWFMRYTNVPGGRLVIHGMYPEARFFSYVAHDETATAMSGLYDIGIEPDPGDANPFISGPSEDRDYTVTIDFGPKRANPAPNTLYTGTTLEGYPNSGGFLIYRLYLPADLPEGHTGNVPLPRATLELPSGSAAIAFESCPPVPPPAAQEPLNQAIEDASRPDGLPMPPPDNRVVFPPKFEVIYNGQVPDAALSQILPPPLYEPLPHRPGTTFGNVGTTYVILLTHRSYGDVLTFRLQAPSFVDIAGGELATARQQVRLWNACTATSPQDGFLALGCVEDFQAETVPPSAAGWETNATSTFVVSDPAHRPTGNMAGVNWLPAGPGASTLIFVRYLLPHPDFPSPADIPEGTDPAKLMGEYFPTAAYCSTEAFNLRGADGCFKAQKDATRKEPAP